MSSGTRPDALGPSPDVLVVGGGLAGPAAAITLARAGRRVTLVEREREPRHKVCGEFLSAEALAMLRGLGLDVVALGGVAIDGVRLCGPRRVLEHRLPFPAMSLTRRCLDPALLALAEAEGVHVLRGTAVTGLARHGGVWRASLTGGENGTASGNVHSDPQISAKDVILATGKHDLRGWARPAGPQNDLVAMKMYWRLAPAQASALRSHVELLLHPGGYTGLQGVEEGANLCCLVERTRLSALGGWPGLLRELQETCALARERLGGAEPLLEKPLAVAAIPYGFVRRRAMDEHLWAVGDQAAVIPSFTGDGMSIALFSGLRAAESLLRGETASDFQAGLHRDLHAQVGRATAISRALVRQPSGAMVLGAVGVWPGLLGIAARLTRVPATAMANIGYMV